MKAYRGGVLILLSLLLLATNACTEEPLVLVPEDRIVVTQVDEDYSAAITIDSIAIKRDSKNGSNVSTSINYQVITYEDVDSIQWIFSGGSPEKVADILNPEITYSGYGNFPAQLILTKYDTLSDNKIFIRRDTIVPEESVAVYFEEKDWDPTQWILSTVGSNTTWNPQDPSATSSDSLSEWTSFPFSNMVILRETSIQDTPNPYKRTAQFSGFNDQRLRISFDFKVSRKGGSKRFTGDGRKFDLVVDGFNRMQVNKTPNDEYQKAAISLQDATDFEIEIIKYPGLSLGAWELIATPLPTICQETEEEGDTVSGSASSTTGSSTTSSSTSSSNTTTSATASSSTSTTTPTASSTAVPETPTTISLYQEYNTTDELFGFVSVTEPEGYFYLNYTQSQQSYQFGTEDGTTLSLTAPCPITLKQGNYKIFVNLDEGFPNSYNTVKLLPSTTFSSTIVDPFLFDIYIKNFKIEPY